MESSHSALKKRIKRLKVIQRIAGPGLKGKVYLVGGALRELALGQVPRDYDFALENPGDSEKLQEIFCASSFVLGKKPIQTQRIVTKDVSLDITFFQGRIDEDLARRDFTMNAIAYDVGRDEIIDPFRGLHDISLKLIRSPREESLQEDPLRMVKAIRHLATLRGFSLYDDLIRSIAAHRQLIRTTAPERIKYELDLIVVAGDAFKGIQVMDETGLLFEIFPEMRALRQIDQDKGFRLETLGHTLDGLRYIGRAGRLRAFDEKQVRQAAYSLLFHDLGKPYTFSYDEEKRRVHFFHHERYSRDIAGKIMERLRFSVAETRTIAALVENHMRLFLISNKGATEKATRRLVYKMGELTPCLVLLTLLDLYGSSKGRHNSTTAQVRKRCIEVLSMYDEWEKKPLPRLITGHDLLSMGFAEGPRIGKILDEIREKQIAGDITEKEEALKYAGESLTRPGP